MIQKNNRLLTGGVTAGILSLGVATTAGAVNTSMLPMPLSDADFISHSAAKVELGKNLFFDKILSGNLNIACATCHHGLTDTGDGLSLPVGEGGRGLGMTRSTGEFNAGVPERVPRNAPPVFNLGAHEFTVMFHDGRLFADPTQPSGFTTPAGDDFPPGLDNALAAQAMFPVTSGTEMAGQGLENEISEVTGDLPELWGRLAYRLQASPEYVDMFKAAYPGDITTAADITYVHAANAIGAFEAAAWRADNSPFDRYLRGDTEAMCNAAKRGMKLFYGRAGCAACHSGPFQTDQSYHAIAMPQIGPGKGHGPSGHEDYGREAVSGDAADRYKFRTPSLRNVALTGPWGHAGAYNSLEAVIRHHLDPVNALHAYDRSNAVLPPLDGAEDFSVMDDPGLIDAIAQANELAPVRLNKRQLAYLRDFIHALTDPGSLDIRQDVPMTVPSGLSLVE